MPDESNPHMPEAEYERIRAASAADENYFRSLPEATRLSFKEAAHWNLAHKDPLRGIRVGDKTAEEAASAYRDGLKQGHTGGQPIRPLPEGVFDGRI